MSATGVLLAFERQIEGWIDRDFRIAPQPSGARRLPIEAVIAKVQCVAGARPSSVTLHLDFTALEIGFGRERTIFADLYSGAVLAGSSKRARKFFSGVERWHRTLGGELRKGSPGRGITGACNLGFLFLIVSGPFLWWPRIRTWRHFRPVLFFRRGLAGRAREWNWHHVIGIWCAIPLFAIVLTGVIMSYQWANNLLYRLTDSPIPAAQATVSGTSSDVRVPGRSGGPASRAVNAPMQDLDDLFARAKRQVPGWRTISAGLLPSREHGVVFSIDQGNGGQPNLRSQLVLDRTTGAVVRWEPFSGQTPGRKLRSLARFLHTGEALGLTGQVVAATASLGACLLVWTGLFLVPRRIRAAITRSESRRTEVKSPTLTST